jgi:hypothetical protein
MLAIILSLFSSSQSRNRRGGSLPFSIAILGQYLVGKINNGYDKFCQSAKPQFLHLETVAARAPP